MTGAFDVEGTAFDPIEFLEAAVPIASDEDVSEMRDFLVATLAEHGVEATVDDAGNTLATRGEGAPHLVLNTHIDTVSPHVPYERDGDVIRGRGSCDAKGPLAALLTGFLAADADEGTLTLAVSPDEEVLSTGAAALTSDAVAGGGTRLDGDAYVVGEPTGLDVCNAAKGRFQGTVTLSGVAAHAAEPDSGVNAVAAAEQALAAIRTFDDDRAAHPSLGEPTLTPTTIDGGTSTNQLAAACEIVVDRRSVPPETAEGFRTELAGALREAVPDDVGVAFDLTDRPSPFLEAFATDRDDPLVRRLADAAGRASAAYTDSGRGGDVRPFTAATEASYFAPAPTVVFGPGDLADDAGAVAHAEREYVRVDEVRAAAAAVTEVVRETVG
ncbi:MAG: M20 family metallopeptidase [Haloferacaceae archaeon]